MVVELHTSCVNTVQASFLSLMWQSYCDACNVEVMVALCGIFLSFSLAFVSLAFLSTFSLHSDGLLLVSYVIPFMGLPRVGCTSQALCFIWQVKLFGWARPSFTVNWAKSLFSPTLVWAPLWIPQQCFYIKDVSNVYKHTTTHLWCNGHSTSIYACGV